MDTLDNKIDRLTQEIYNLRTEVRVGFAKLPSEFVPRAEVDATKKEAMMARRWSIGTAITVIGILVSRWPF